MSLTFSLPPSLIHHSHHSFSLTHTSQVEMTSDIVQQVLGVRLPRKAFHGARAATLVQLSMEETKVGAVIHEMNNLDVTYISSNLF